MKLKFSLLCLFLAVVCSGPAAAAADNVSGAVGFIEQNPRILSPSGKTPSEDELTDEFIENAEGFKPKDGFVPNAETAINVAEAVLTPIYGEEVIKKEKPFKARLKNEIWIVSGSMPSGLTLGGVSHVKISKQNGAILLVTHGQ